MSKHKNISYVWWIGCVALYVVAATGCTKTYSTVSDTSLLESASSITNLPSLLGYLQNNSSYSIFYYGLQKSGLDKLITDDKKLTLLIPNNTAFTSAGITQDSLSGMDTATLRKWMGFHIVQGSVQYDSIAPIVDNVYYSILGQKLFFSKPTSGSTTKSLSINGVTVPSFDLKASNGFIQLLSAPLNAPVEYTLQDYINANPGTYSLWKACLQHYNLWNRLVTDTAKELTLLAPVNTAFATYNITADTIAAWDTTKIPSYLFEVYLVPARIFSNDFAYLSGGTYTYTDNIVKVTLSSSSSIYAGFVSTTPPYTVKASQTASIYSSGKNIAILDGNHVLQPINNILLVP